MSKSQQSIWTADITPHVVRVLTMDITPDFSSPFWQKDVSGHMLVTLAIFGLVASSFFTAIGVASVGVNVEVAFAQRTNEITQTASVANAMPASATLLPSTASRALASTTPPQPSPVPVAVGGMNASSAVFCPQLAKSVMRGTQDATSTGDVTQLQLFLSNKYGLSPSDSVTGYFGPTTQKYLERFQQEQGIPPAPQAGPLTRSAIAKLCGQAGGQSRNNGQMGSSTPMMGSTTPSHAPVMPRPAPTTTVPVPPIMPPTNASSSTLSTVPVTNPPPPVIPVIAPNAPVSYNDNSSNTASLVDAVNEIGDGYGHLLQATLGMFGL